MSGAEYVFLTRWSINAPQQAVWDVIAQVERWVAWWQGLERVEPLAPGDARRVGRCCRLTWKGRLPYRLIVDMTTVRIEAPRLLESAANGELEGRGIWRLSSHDDGTAVTYEWRVRTTKPWMNLIAPLARPIFAWNHDVVMRQGQRGLKQLLEPISQRRRTT